MPGFHFRVYGSGASYPQVVKYGLDNQSSLILCQLEVLRVMSSNISDKIGRETDCEAKVETSCRKSVPKAATPYLIWEIRSGMTIHGSKIAN
jgi:hypothetical protein